MLNLTQSKSQSVTSEPHREGSGWCETEGLSFWRRTGYSGVAGL